MGAAAAQNTVESGWRLCPPRAAAASVPIFCGYQHSRSPGTRFPPNAAVGPWAVTLAANCSPVHSPLERKCDKLTMADCVLKVCFVGETERMNGGAEGVFSDGDGSGLWGRAAVRWKNKSHPPLRRRVVLSDGRTDPTDGLFRQIVHVRCSAVSTLCADALPPFSTQTAVREIDGKRVKFECVALLTGICGQCRTELQRMQIMGRRGTGRRWRCDAFCDAAPLGCGFCGV